MAAWRDFDLETIFGGSLDRSGLTEASVIRVVAEHVHESEVLDFKETLWARSSGPRGPWSPEQEFAKDVACLANRRGGVLLVGVAEASGEASSVAPLAKVDREVEERRLRQALVNYQAPVAVCEFVWISGAGDQSYLAVVVPRSLRAPHAVVSERGGSRRALRYPERHGTDTVWLTESEVAERYRRRFDAQVAERARLDRVVSDGCEALRVRARSDVWLFVALVPELPVPGRLDNQTVEAIERWHRARSTNSPLNRWISAFGRAIPAPGMVTFTRSQRDRSEDETLVGEAYVELHVDGSAYAALPVREHSTDIPNLRILSDVLLVDDVFLLVDQVLRWSSYQAGAWGVTTLVLE